MIFRSFSPGKEVFIREKIYIYIYIYHLSRYKIPADSERKIVDLLCLIAQKIESKGRAHCRADPRLTSFARYSSGVTDTFPFVWDGPQDCHTGENSEGFLGCE